MLDTPDTLCDALALEPSAPARDRAAESSVPMALRFTGERFVPTSPECSANIAYEHWHRYAYAARFVSGKRVLDVACGEGYGTALLAREAVHVTGVDIDVETLAHARAVYARNNVDFLEGSATSIPIEGSGVFDAIVSFETIEHIDAPSQRAFLAEVRRLLKPDGVFLVSSPDKRTYSDEPNYRNEFHIKEFYREEFDAFLSESFRYVSILGQAVHGVSYIHRFDSREPPFFELGVTRTDTSELRAEEASPHHLYLIAVCSNAAAVEAPASLLVDRTEALLDARALDARAHVALQDATIADLEQTLQRRDAELAEIHGRLPMRAYAAAKAAVGVVAARARSVLRVVAR
jgi:SAM-dependent methyltransferase